MKALAPAVASVTFPPLFPDSGPEHVIRQVVLHCEEQSACKGEFLLAWQATTPGSTPAGEPPASPTLKAPATE